MSGRRFHVLRGGGVSLVIDIHPGGTLLPRIVHFGIDPGSTEELTSLVVAQPSVLWGARLDQSRPPCILPGAEEGYFGAAAVQTGRPAQFRVQDVMASDRSITIQLSAGNDHVSVSVEYRMSAHGVLSGRTTCGGGPGAVSRLVALALALPAHFEDLVSFGGDWAREFAMHRQTLGPGRHVIESRRGRPGHDRFPGLFLGERGFGNDHGEVVGVTLGWSGSHQMSVESLREGGLMVQAGELHDGFEALPADYQSPWCHVVHSNRGLNGAMQALHAFTRAEILPAKVAARPRPVHYNTWEAIYFRHDMATLLDLADRAAQAGAERFVLDDGWFKGRNDDRAGLGDWTVDALKYPDGLKPLIDHVQARGMEFGLWVEPEMVNPDSDLARAHPDWIRRDIGEQILMRHQCVLDLARTEVQAHLFAGLDRLLSDYAISYLKWDMNRDLTGLGHADYVRGVHALIDQLRTAHPALEIETCASGGGRCDYGMLARAERVWVSDSNDALDRFDIQRNANLFLPPEAAGVHVGPATCHITGRKLSLDLRAHVAMFGHMGLELDLRRLEAAELQRLSAHITTYKTFRSLVHTGLWWRIDLPGPDHQSVGVSDPDGSEALCLVVRAGSQALGRGTWLRVPGLDPKRLYRIAAAGPHASDVENSVSPALRSGNLELRGHMLEARGLPVFLPRPATSLLLHVKAA
jgi:alpha-galactosidase